MTMLKGKVVLITGAASGIGKAIAKKFSALGSKIVIVDLDSDGLKRVESECLEINGQQNGFVASIVGDLTEDEFCKKVIEGTLTKMGALDVLINNAGVIRAGPLGEVPMEDYDLVMKTNVRAVFMLTQIAIPHLKLTSGCIVNLTSTGGERPYPNLLAYGMSKAAVLQFTKCAANELAQFGIRVNSVTPGAVQTGMTRKLGLTDEVFEDFAKKMSPLKRTITGEDIARAVVFLADPKNKAVTGESLLVDCGAMVKSPAD